MRRSENRFPAVALAAAALALTASGVQEAGAQLPGITLENHATGFSRPVALIQDPSNRDVQYVVQQRGLIRVLVNGTLIADPFMDLTALVNQTVNEGGLLGLAFPPDYGATGRFYVSYTNAGNTQSHIVRYLRDPNNPLKGDPTSAEIILTVGQPFSNHNGGNIIFGMDGMLYIGYGDGGSGGDPGHRAQNPNTLLGKMLRIDVSPQSGYAIPPDNPFVDGNPINALHEIWAFGVRNPWRWSFDNWNHGGTGAMLIGDVGQSAREEISFEHAGDGGRNYGWRNREGTINHNTSLPPAYTPLIDPIHDYVYGSTNGRCVTGGYVYRGTLLGSAWRGRYFFADYIDRRVWSFALDQSGSGSASDVINHTDQLGGQTFLGNLPSFGEDADGELYIASFNGTIRRIAPTETTTLQSVQVNFGSHVSGGVAELERSDNQYYVVNSAFGFTAQEPNVSEIEALAQTTASSTPSLLDVVIETRINNPGGSATIRMFNVNNSNWALVGSHTLSQTDTVYRFENVSNPGRFVPANGQVRLRSRHVVMATFAISGFQSSYDRLAIVIRN